MGEILNTFKSNIKSVSSVMSVWNAVYHCTYYTPVYFIFYQLESFKKYLFSFIFHFTMLIPIGLFIINVNLILTSVYDSSTLFLSLCLFLNFKVFYSKELYIFCSFKQLLFQISARNLFKIKKNHILTCVLPKKNIFCRT